MTNLLNKMIRLARLSAERSVPTETESTAACASGKRKCNKTSQNLSLPIRTAYLAWIPTLSGVLSLKNIGSTTHPTPAVSFTKCINSSTRRTRTSIQDQELCYIVSAQVRMGSDALLAHMPGTQRFLRLLYSSETSSPSDGFLYYINKLLKSVTINEQSGDPTLYVFSAYAESAPCSGTPKSREKLYPYRLRGTVSIYASDYIPASTNSHSSTPESTKPSKRNIWKISKSIFSCLGKCRTVDQHIPNSASGTHCSEVIAICAHHGCPVLKNPVCTSGEVSLSSTTPSMELLPNAVFSVFIRSTGEMVIRFIPDKSYIAGSTSTVVRSGNNAEVQSTTHILQQYIDRLAEQVFFFVKDISHVHKHHHPFTDKITSPIRSDIPNWRIRFAQSMLDETVAVMRSKKISKYLSALGIIQYVHSFVTISKSMTGSFIPSFLFERVHESSQILIESKRNADKDKPRLNTAIASFSLISLLFTYTTMYIQSHRHLATPSQYTHGDSRRVYHMEHIIELVAESSFLSFSLMFLVSLSFLLLFIFPIIKALPIVIYLQGALERIIALIDKKTLIISLFLTNIVIFFFVYTWLLSAVS